MAATLESRSRKKSVQQQAIAKIVSKKVVPPIVALVIFLLIWQLLTTGENPNLPSPVTVLQETWDPYIINPFFDNGGTDKGLGLQIIASLGRVAIGFSSTLR